MFDFVWEGAGLLPPCDARRVPTVLLPCTGIHESNKRFNPIQSAGIPSRKRLEAACVDEHNEKNGTPNNLQLPAPFWERIGTQWHATLPWYCHWNWARPATRYAGATLLASTQRRK